MEESQEILFKSLASSGFRIPPGVSSIGDLTPATLYSICAHSLRIVSGTSTLPATLPESMAEQFKICTDLASSVKDFGFVGDLSFHQFLYPSEEDMYKLVRFLVGRLSESSQTSKSSEETDKINTHESEESFEDEEGGLRDRLKDLRLRTEVEPSESKERDGSDLVVPKNGAIAGSDHRAGIKEGGEDQLNSVENSESLVENVWDSRSCVSGNGETVDVCDGEGHASELQQPLNSSQEKLSEMVCDIEKLRSREKLLLEELSAKSLELQHLEEEHNLFEAAVDMALSEQSPVESYVTQLIQEVDSRRHNVVELESKWEAIIKPLEEKKITLEEVLCAAKPEIREKLQSLKKTELKIQSILSETKKRDEQKSRLLIEVEKQPKLAPRVSHIERIKEITKNSRKQDIDIERILKETRELQLESNSIRERLHRTYAVVDEMVLRETKKDHVGQQVHKLLTSIHENFELISEKILATDRTRREATDYEAKLSKIASRSLNIDKLQADLDAIRKENEFLQSRIDST